MASIPASACGVDVRIVDTARGNRTVGSFQEAYPDLLGACFYTQLCLKVSFTTGSSAVIGSSVLSGWEEDGRGGKGCSRLDAAKRTLWVSNKDRQN
jgi:hypothetical protein